MSGRLQRLGLLVALAAGLWAAPVLADEGSSRAPADDKDKMARLEALLEAQQKKIDTLEQRVATGGQQDADRARVEQMKQQIREVLSEQEFRESLMPTTVQAGYDKGFFIRSSDEKFLMKFNGVMQFRWTYYRSQPKNHYLAPGFKRHDRTGFDIARGRFRFSGYVYTKDLTYLLELDMSSPSGYDARLYYFWVNYRFLDEFQFKAGLFRVASTRANFMSTALMQFVEYPMMDAVFGYNNGLGVRAWGQLFKKRVEYYVDVVNSLNTPSTQTITTDEDWYTSGHDSNPAILARAVWHALVGETSVPLEDTAHFDTPSDIERHTQPALDIGMHYVFDDNYHDVGTGTLRIPFPRRTFREGGFGLTSAEGLQINQFGFDAAFKYMGFSISGEYVLRILDVRNSDHRPFTPLYLLTGNESTDTQQGAYVQCGYFLPIPGLEKKLELVGRVGGVSTLAGRQEGNWDYGGGLNYYIDGHRVKLQTDVTKVTESAISNPAYSLANVNDSVFVWRVQLQVAF